MLSRESRRELLRIARGAIAGALGQPTDPTPATQNDTLRAACGAFVTLRVNHTLRGCIGYIESSLPLAEVVAEVALKAAFEDPRFPPLTAAEFKNVTIEISVLSPLERVARIEDIQVGVHGLLLECGPRRGLLLPQVALEYEWDREAFLNATARKAGLPDRAWEDEQAALYLFTADIVEEQETAEESRS